MVVHLFIEDDVEQIMKELKMMLCIEIFLKTWSLFELKLKNENHSF